MSRRCCQSAPKRSNRRLDAGAEVLRLGETRNDEFGWFHTVEIVMKILADAGSKALLAAVFSGREDGVGRFLHDVEGSSVAAA
jgi:hypothetical protein